MLRNLPVENFWIEERIKKTELESLNIVSFLFDPFINDHCLDAHFPCLSSDVQ